MKNKISRSILVGVIWATGFATAQEPATGRGGDVWSWRNGGSGVFAGGAALPTQWSGQQHVRWRTALPHRSNASPILVGNRIFVCAEPDELLAFAADTGQLLWRQIVSYLDTAELVDPQIRALWEQQRAARLKQYQPSGLDLGHHPQMLEDAKELPERLQRPKNHVDTGFTTPTPVSDGQNVFAFFATGIAASFDATGQRRWAVLLEKPAIRWGHAASPVIVDGRLIVHAERCYAADLANGRTLWSSPARRRWATPAAMRLGAEWFLILGGGEVLRARDGALMADLFPHTDACDIYVNYWGMSSPLAVEQSVYFIDATPCNAKTTFSHSETAPTAQCFDLRGESDGRVTGVRRWRVELPRGKYYASPVLLDRRLYLVASTLRLANEKGFDHVLNRRVDGTLLALDAAQGTVLFAHEIGKDTGTYHTLIAAAGKLWMTGHTGITVVAAAEAQYRELARNTLEPIRSHPIVAGNDIILRTHEHLFRISAEAK